MEHEWEFVRTEFGVNGQESIWRCQRCSQKKVDTHWGPKYYVMECDEEILHQVMDT